MNPVTKWNNTRSILALFIAAAVVVYISFSSPFAIETSNKPYPLFSNPYDDDILIVSANVSTAAVLIFCALENELLKAYHVMTNKSEV